jgi:hypothetical protein
MPIVPKPLPTNSGLLAFIYDYYTNPQKAAAFQADPTGFMSTYALTYDQMKAVWETGLKRDEPKNEPAWDALANGALPPAAPQGGWVDSEWPNDGAMELLGKMLIDVLAGKPQWEFAW